MNNGDPEYFANVDYFLTYCDGSGLKMTVFDVEYWDGKEWKKLFSDDGFKTVEDISNAVLQKVSSTPHSSRKRYLRPVKLY